MQSLRFDGSCCWFECFLIKPGLNMPKNILKAFTKGKNNSNSVFRSFTVCFGWLIFLWCFLLFFGFRQCLVIIRYTFVTLKMRYSANNRVCVCVCVCVWTFHFQVEAVKEMLYQLEETFLKKKALRASKQQKAKEKKALKKLSLGSPTVPPQGQPNAVAYPQPSHPISEHLPPPHKHLSSAKK